MIGNGIFIANLVSTLFLVGLIWTIQIVHYRLFDRVGEQQFVRYESDHSRLITPLVGPMMLVELATAALLVLGLAPPWVPRSAAAVGLVAVVLIWLSTALLQVPCHSRLMQGFDRDTYLFLVRSNWIRTALWTGRGAWLTYLLWRGLQSLGPSPLES